MFKRFTKKCKNSFKKVSFKEVFFKDSFKIHIFKDFDLYIKFYNIQNKKCFVNVKS